MIFDDHDLIDDWNTSAAWVADMRATPWWQKRVTSGLMSYWVYQHLGNLTPAELEMDKTYAAVRSAPDGTETLRAFATKADADPASVRWSYRRDFGRTRLVMVDSRAARVLEEQRPGDARPGGGRLGARTGAGRQGLLRPSPRRHLAALAAAAADPRRRELERGAVPG